MSENFVWDDAGRVVVFRRDGLARALAILAEHGFAEFELLSTGRALAEVPALAAAARAVHEVPAGQVPDLAADLLGVIAISHQIGGSGLSGRESPGREEGRPPALVALGGGRVIDVAKALASVHGARVAAIPTTMSGAEMSQNHRLPAGAEDRVAQWVRPALVIADPEAMTGQPEAELRASSMNALAHGADCLYTPLANPVSRMTALRGAELIASSLDQGAGRRERSDLALGSILCGDAVDSANFGLHHPVCQTLVRVCGTPHAGTNAAILPRSMAFLALRAPGLFAQLATAIGTDLDGLQPRLNELGGDPPGFGALGGDRSQLDRALATMLERPELGSVPGPRPTGPELAGIVESAWQ
ncbi:MAG: iron-containing alcohol dehydrogenase [Solirubrobacterales bacterium]